MRKISHVIVLSDYRIALTFDDGREGIVDLSDLVGKGVFAAWNDYAAFRNCRIGPNGELEWDADIDLCPDALYLEVTGQRPQDLFPGLAREDARA